MIAGIFFILLYIQVTGTTGSGIPNDNDKMHSVYWVIAVLLAVGSSEICYAGPLHAQCKVEWYDVFSLYTICFFVAVVLLALP